MSEQSTSDISKLVSVLKLMDKGLYKNERRNEDIYGLSLLQNLLHDHPHVSFTTSAMRPYCVAHIINDVLINRRESVIELGAGISTLLLARLVKLNKLSTTIVSVDHNQEWLELIRVWLQREHLEEIVNLVYAPLTYYDQSLENNAWYDTTILTAAINVKKFDMLLIDGPPAHDDTRRLARFPAVPFFLKFMKNRFSVFLDDINRNGEQEIVRYWTEKYGLRFNITGQSMAYHFTGDSFFTEPIGHF